MIVTFKSYVQPRVKTRVASKTSLSIADHLQATFINRSTCQAYIETLKMSLMHKQPKKWWTNRQTDKQTNKPNTLPLLRMRTHGEIKHVTSRVRHCCVLSTRYMYQYPCCVLSTRYQYRYQLWALMSTLPKYQNQLRRCRCWTAVFVHFK